MKTALSMTTRFNLHLAIVGEIIEITSKYKSFLGDGSCLDNDCLLRQTLSTNRSERCTKVVYTQSSDCWRCLLIKSPAAETRRNGTRLETRQVSSVISPSDGGATEPWI